MRLSEAGSPERGLTGGGRHVRALESLPDEPPRDELPLHPVHVVGDRYRTFAENDRVTTSGAVAKALTTPAPLLSDQVLLVPGQGVTEEDWHTLAAAPTQRTVRFGAAPAPALDGSEVLKLRSENVLLAALRETGPVTYTAELVVHADSEMVQDHTAERQHLPGMLLMEASCQMIIAVTGRFLASRGVTDAYYTVMHHFEIDFRRFVFPLPAQLPLTVDEMGDLTGGPDRIPFAVTSSPRHAAPGGPGAGRPSRRWSTPG